MQHMTRLVDDLLDVSRITRGKIELRKEVVDLASVVDRAVEATRPLIEDRRHELTVDLPPEPVRLEADPTRLAQVLANLLNNAAKYTDHGRPHLADRPAGGRRVGPAGAGHRHGHCAGHARPHLRAVRAGGSGAAPLPGRPGHRADAGAAAWWRCTAARVDAHSEGPGKGSEFVVRLPALSPKQPITGARAAGEGGEPVGTAPSAASWSWTTTWTPPRAWRCC